MRKLISTFSILAASLVLSSCGGGNSSSNDAATPLNTFTQEDAASSLVGLLYAVNTTDLNSVEINSMNSPFQKIVSTLSKEVFDGFVQINSDSGTANCASGGSIYVTVTENTSTHLHATFDFQGCTVYVNCNGSKKIIINDPLSYQLTLNENGTVLASLSGNLNFSGDINTNSCSIDVAILYTDTSLSSEISETATACGYNETVIDPLIQTYCSI